ncbi:high affinity immunoglobulin epsilon receptor subunit gamma isoform X1 [Zonotrichia albicollis]|uniref:high affinity immunoglobulin epsilon receptor subunit gamma isoform X1 n=1 Tax=Zonotrichia albicollis TaxID=44394 RepID=UPI003D8111A0
MGTLGQRCLLCLVLLGLHGRAAGALAEPELCYVLDAVLFLYSLILTGLYVRLRFLTRRSQKAAEKKEEEGRLCRSQLGAPGDLRDPADEELLTPPVSPPVPSCVTSPVPKPRHPLLTPNATTRTEKLGFSP